MKLFSPRSITFYGVLFGTLFSFFGATAQQATDTVAFTKAHAEGDDIYYDAVKAKILGDDKTAQSLFLQFSRLKPDEAATYYELASLSLKASNADDAEKYAQKAISLDSTNKWYKIQYAGILADHNDFTEAAQIFDRLSQTEENNEDYLLSASLYYTRAEKYDQALAMLDKLIVREGPDDDILLKKEQIYLKMNKLDKAADIIHQLIAQNPDQSKYYVLLAELYNNNNEPAKAKQTLDDASKKYKNDPSIDLGIAQYYAKQGDSAQYRKYLKQAIESPSLDIETQAGLFVSYLQELPNDSLRKIDGLEIASRLYQLHPDDATITALYGDVLSINGDNAKAVVQYKKALGIDPSSYTVWQKLLFASTGPKDADSLVAYSERAMRLFPNQAVVYYMDGVGNYNRKQYATAIKWVNRAIDLSPDDNKELLAEMYAMLGDLYNIEKAYPQSDSSFIKAIALDPDNASTLNNYSYYLSLRNTRLGEAEKMSKHSLELRADEPTFLDTYGWILYKEGKYTQAKEYIEKAIGATPDADGTLFEHLGDVYYKLNDTSKAIENWQKAKDKGDENPQLEKQIQDRKLYE